MVREAVTGTTTNLELLVIMSEGNPGALTALTQILNKDPVTGVMTILHMDDMNIRGPQVWVGYKDYCGEDIEKFVEALQKRDEGMVLMINERVGGDEPAVTSGGSRRIPIGVVE